MVWGLGCRVWGLGFRVWGLGLPGAPILARTDRYSSQFKNNYVAEMCSGSQAGSYLRLIDSCITQLKAQGPSRTCDESKEEDRCVHRSRSAPMWRNCGTVRQASSRWFCSLLRRPCRGTAPGLTLTRLAGVAGPWRRL